MLGRATPACSLSLKILERIIERVTQPKAENIKNLELRAKLPRIFRFAAIGLLGVTVWRF